jgi:septal ring factor EnvC (AmiA/AmiB activator)
MTPRSPFHASAPLAEVLVAGNAEIERLEAQVASKEVELSRANAEAVRLRTSLAELEGANRKMRHEAAAGLANDELFGSMERLQRSYNGAWSRRCGRSIRGETPIVHCTRTLTIAYHPYSRTCRCRATRGE